VMGVFRVHETRNEYSRPSKSAPAEVSLRIFRNG
jgi:hypothetical protein